MSNQGTIEKVVELVQSDVKAKKFRTAYDVSEELRIEMVSEVFQDYMMFARDNYYEACMPMLNEYVDEHRPRRKKRGGLIQNLFWFRMMYDASLEPRNNSIEAYITENYHLLHKKPFMISWLRECAKAVPKFYYIGHKHNDHVIVAIDMLEEKPLDVIIYAADAITPKQGEIAMGTLIPLGGGLFFPIGDFYHFDYQAREAMASCFHHHYHKHLQNSTMHEAFIHVLSVMLQIESIIFHEKKGKQLTK
jgi:hypothetical protein